MMEPNTENIWYIFTAAGDEAITAHIAALVMANEQYQAQYLEGRHGPDVEDALPFPHAEQVLETIRNIREQRADLWQQGNAQSQPVQDAMGNVQTAADELRRAWTTYQDAILVLGHTVANENLAIDR